jgi:hypothetical protein
MPKSSACSTEAARHPDQRLPERQPKALDQRAGEIGADGKEHGVTKGKQPGDAKDQVVAQRVESEDEDLDRQPLHEFGDAGAVRQHRRRRLTFQQADDKGQQDDRQPA